MAIPHRFLDHPPIHHNTRAPRLTPLARAALGCLLLSGATAGTAVAQTADGAASTLDPVTIKGRASQAVDVGGWGPVAPSKAPFQASVISLENQRDRGFTRLSDVTRVDPAVGDAYNSEGYWDYLSIRGYVVDNRGNYRRDGLPISAETTLPLDNKERIEVLKGTSGMQAGTSAPGGLVNLVVKRPLDEPLRSVLLEWRDTGALLGAVDISQRLGPNRAFGLRVNAAHERLESSLRDQQGHRMLLAVAGDWRISPDTLLEAEWEASERSQRSQPGFSMLGDRVPAPADPRINLNNQPWSLPVVTQADTASLRFSQKLNAQWRWTAHAASQRLASDDRLAYPFGCSAEDNYHRYCADGTYDLYDFRSENERRHLHSLELAVHGEFKTGALAHQVSWGVLRSNLIQRFQAQAYNYVGTGNVQGTVVTPPYPSLTDENTNRDEHSTELFLRDAVQLAPAWKAWLGVRHTRLQRESVRTDGSRPTDYSQSFTTPWLALSHALNADTTAYASWGQGIESEVAPNRARFTNRGQALPALRSRQMELGLKNGGADLNWGVALFDISRPMAASIGSDCDSDATGNTCTRQSDGQARHKGVELNAGWRGGPWVLQGGVQWLHARRENSVDPAVNGKEPVNVPATTVKLQARYNVAQLPGLALLADLIADSRRQVLPDNSASIPGTQRVDVGLRYAQATGGNGQIVWRAGISNLFDKQAWREAPYQFDHVYLFPMAPRTFRVSLQMDL